MDSRFAGIDFMARGGPIINLIGTSIIYAARLHDRKTVRQVPYLSDPFNRLIRITPLEPLLP